MKKSFALLLSVGFLLAVLTVGAAAAEPITLKYAQFAPKPTFVGAQLERWKQEVEKRTGGKVKVNAFHGGTLLGAKDMMDGVIAGTSDIGCLCMAYQPGRFVVTNATSLPLGFPNARVASLTLWGLYNKYKPKSFDKVKVLTMFTCGTSNIMSKVPVRKLADMKGLDLRASGGAGAILKAWGANQIGMPMSKVPEALQKGTVKGLFSSLEVMKDFKFAELCKFVTITDTVIYPFAVVMNKAKWDSLPADVKKVLDGLAKDQCVWTGTYMDKHVKEAMAWSVKTQKVEVTKLSPDTLGKWNKLLVPIVGGWIKKVDAKGFKGKAIVDDIKALMKKNM